MSNRFIILTSLVVVLLLVSSIGGQSLSAYAARNTPPSFSGGTYLKYHDGLKINGQVIDISRYIQKLDTPIVLPLGQPSIITLKIFDNDGPTTVKAAAIYGNSRGTLSTSTGDTSIVYFIDKKQVTVTDPHKLFGTVTAEYQIIRPFVYVTFHVTPIAKLDTSNFSVAAMDNQRSFANSLLLDAIQFS